MDISLAKQIASFAAAFIILAAYLSQQMGWMDTRKAPYNFLNATGAAVLAYIAFHPFQLGFVFLEASWALISIYVLFRRRVQQ